MQELFDEHDEFDEFSRQAEQNFSETIALESLQHKCQATPTTAMGVSLVIAFLCYMLATRGSLDRPIELMWPFILVGLFIGRLMMSRVILVNLYRWTESGIAMWERRLLVSSLLNQTFVGCSILLYDFSDGLELPGVMTAVITMHGLGAMINLYSDKDTFRLTLVPLFLPSIYFWASFGGTYWGISGVILLIAVLMVNASGNMYAVLQDSIRIRFEKHAAAQALEKANAKLEVEQERVESALATAKEAIQSKAMFMAAASHDLKQPLYAISVFNNALREQVADKEVLGTVIKQGEAIELAKSMFENLLQLNAFEAGNVDTKIVPVDLYPLIKPLDIEFEALCGEKNLNWEVEYPEIVVEADPEWLNRLLMNLISNAVKYTEEGTVSLKVEVSEGHACFVVADSGIGMTPAEQEIVFEEFVQLNNRSRQSDKGAGLGLAIVRHICERMDIDLILHSEFGVGSEFSFELPMHAISEKTEIAADLRGFELWLMEDEDIVRAALLHQFLQWGLEVRLFESPEEILTAAELEGYKVGAVVLDNLLGLAKTGSEIAAELAEFIPAERISVCSAYELKTLAVQPEDIGFEFWAKPVDMSAIKLWLGRLKEIKQGPFG